MSSIFLQDPVNVKEYPVYVHRKFSKSIPNILFIPDIRLVKTNSGKMIPKTEKVFLDQIVEALKINGLNPYILTFDDFASIPYLL